MGFHAIIFLLDTMQYIKEASLSEIKFNFTPNHFRVSVAMAVARVDDAGKG